MSASPRADLLALDESKLASLANRGLVKRAQKDLEAGQAPELTLEGDTVVAKLGDVVTKLPPATSLSDAPCSCGALKACRHRVLAVLAYQARFGGEASSAASPAPPAALPDFDDAALEAHTGPRTFERATRARNKGYVADVLRGDVPQVELSTCTVRFLVPNDLAYARCDCQLGQRCEHVVLAVWAMREARARQADADRVTIEIGERASSRIDALDAALELVRELLLDGAEGSGQALGVRFARAVKPLEEAKLRWPITICEELEEVLVSYGSRAASYRPELVGSLATELFARARAGRGSGEIPARAVLGMDEPAKTLLEHVRLVSLGVRLHRELGAEPGKARARADVYLADPDTLTVLVLRKSWEVGEDELGSKLATRTILSGVSLGTLARGQVVTRAAERAANRSVAIGTSRVARTAVTPSSGRWDFGEPLGYERFEPLYQRLQERPPAFVRPRLLAERVHVLRIASVGERAYHAGDQVLRALVFDGEGVAIELAIEHSRAAPGALDTLANALDGKWGAPQLVSGEIQRDGARTWMRPIAVVVPDRVLALDLESSEPASLPSAAWSRSPDPFASALAEARDHLDAGAHHGLLHASDAWRSGLAKIETSLAGVGLRTCAERMAHVRTAMAARVTGDRASASCLGDAWLEASLRVRLALAS